jgi:hypothetical protein
LTIVGTAQAGPTVVEKCQVRKLQAIGKRDFCRAKENQKTVLGKTPNLEKCAVSFAKDLAAADKAAALHGTSCRWLEPGDGTATDLNTGLQWELKTFGDFSDPHGANAAYQWTTSPEFPDANGPAFGLFLSRLNGGKSFDGISARSTTCLGEKCDWRLPTVEELRSILTAQYPDCPPWNPQPVACTTIPGVTLGGFNPEIEYWTASTDEADATQAWTVSFKDGFVRKRLKIGGFIVRAVRGQS